ncbi:hypothetical protein DIPPA_09367 [Diplonema papillatum]|nr:hypothetical protein DIPPA_09367 [Diplonema papillatum]KAJ9450580.1 hypothetical protein DIPPA_09367 [Diplonema papillatum]
MVHSIATYGHVNAEGKTLKEFNTWLVGGVYATQQKHEPASLRKSDSSERLKKKMDELKKKLQASQRRCLERRRPCDPATAKPAAGKGEGEAKKIAARPTPKPPCRPNTGGSSCNQRLLLKSSLIDQITQSNYISMFPPLFTPYDRKNTMLRGWDGAMKRYYTEFDPQTLQREAGFEQEPVVAACSRKPPASGRPGFYPTGHSVNAYRHYTNYRLALESERAARQQNVPPLAKKRHAPNNTLQELLRAQCASSGGRGASGAGTRLRLDGESPRDSAGVSSRQSNAAGGSRKSPSLRGVERIDELPAPDELDAVGGASNPSEGEPADIDDLRDPTPPEAELQEEDVTLEND